MSYTKAFNHLHRLAFAHSGVRNKVQYKLVAIYLGRVMMAETAVDRECGRGEKANLDSPITTSMEWVESMKGQKELMIEHFLGINDYEWSLISKAMMEYTERSQGSEIWKHKRRGWIIGLESLRAFHQD